MKQIWKGEKRQKAEHLIGRLLAEKKLNGWTVNFQNNLHFRALQALSERALSQGEILQTLTEMENEAQRVTKRFKKRDRKRVGAIIESGIFTCLGMLSLSGK